MDGIRQWENYVFAKLTKISHYTIIIFHLFFPLSDTASNLLQ